MTAGDAGQCFICIQFFLCSPVVLHFSIPLLVYSKGALLGEVGNCRDPLSNSLTPTGFGHTFHMYILTPPLLFIQLL